MDPRETLRIADQAVSDCDAEKAREHLDNYYKWRAVGGFEPNDVAGSRGRGDDFARNIAGRLNSLELCA